MSVSSIATAPSILLQPVLAKNAPVPSVAAVNDGDADDFGGKADHDSGSRVNITV